MNIKKTLKSNRIPAFLLVLVMVVALFAGSILPTFAAGNPVSWQQVNEGTVFAGYDSSNTLTGVYLYALGFTNLMNTGGEEAYKFDDQYFAFVTNAIGNVYHDLTGANGTKNKLVCGGEVKNPARADVPVIYNSSTFTFLAGPYTTTQGQTFYYMDAGSNSQGAVGDGNLQGPEPNSTPKTDVTVILNDNGTITVTPTPLVPGETTPPGGLLGPDVNGDWYKPTDTPNIYEIVDEDGTSKDPEKFIFDTDKDGNPLTGGNLVVKPDGGKWYTENPKDIYREIDANGHPKSENAGIWVGNDGKFGTPDDKPASKKSDGNWYADMGQNIFHDVDGPNKGKLVGGGWDYNPVSAPVLPIFEKNGTYYVGPMQDNDGYDYYFGDAADGNGLVESSASNTSADDVIWYLGLDGNMTTEKPQYMPDGVIKVGDDFWQLLPDAGNGTDIYGKVTVSPDGKLATPILENGKKLIVDQASKAPTNQPTLADDRWFDVNDLSSNIVNPNSYDSNGDGYLNPTEYANYLNGIDTAGSVTLQEISKAGFQVIAHSNEKGEITGWGGQGFSGASYALVLWNDTLPCGQVKAELVQHKINDWFEEHCPSAIKSAATGAVFSTEATNGSTNVGSTGISVGGPGGSVMAFPLSATEAHNAANIRSTGRIWTRSIYNSGNQWFVSTTGVISPDYASGSAYVRPALWVKIVVDDYAISNLGYGASSYDSNSDGRLNATEYANYQAGLTANGKLTIDAISEAGFQIVAYANNSSVVTGWSGAGFGGARYALIIANDAIASNAPSGQVQSKLNTWFYNTCPENIRDAVTGSIFQTENGSTNAASTGLSTGGPGGSPTPFLLSAAEVLKWGNRMSDGRIWTRSIYNSGNQWFVSSQGYLSPDYSSGSALVRPALWVQVG